MPQVGEIVRDGRSIGYRGQRPFVWLACLDCGKERWVGILHGEPRSLRCPSCKGLKGEKNKSWKGGRFVDKYGYILIRLYPDDFFYPMVDKRNYVREHRLVVAQSLSRCLLPWEIVHHKNGDKNDNRLENLILLSGNKYHIIDTITKGRIKQLTRIIKNQEKQIKLLKAQGGKGYGLP